MLVQNRAYNSASGIHQIGYHPKSDYIIMNKYLLLLIASAMSSGAYAQASPETSSGIGYKSVSAAYEALSTKEGVEGSNQGGWVIL